MPTGPAALPPPARPGDRVAVLSPSWCAPATYPTLHERAMERLRSFGVEPVEYPTTRRQGSPQERAADLMAAFADPEIRAVLATIGGEDQVTVIRHLDPAVVAADPKRLLGYSDNTNLLSWLWYHGVGSVHGGSTQVHLAPDSAVHPAHAASLRAALFGGDLTVTPLSSGRDLASTPWSEPPADPGPLVEDPAAPWEWTGPQRRVRGRTWGGNIEVLQWVLAVGRWVHPPEAYDGGVLLLETSEEMPSPTEVSRMVRNLGERGILEVVAGVVLGRAQAANSHPVPPLADRDAYRRAVADAAREMLARYAPEAVVVSGPEIGHTLPQWCVPYGGELTLDPSVGHLVAHFGPGS